MTNHEETKLEILLARMDRRNLTPKISKQDENNVLIEFSTKELSAELREQSEQAQIHYEETFKYSIFKSMVRFFD